MLLISALLLTVFAVPYLPQTQAVSNDSQKISRPAARRAASENNTAIVPQQLHKAEPPSPAASAEELEATGDQLRDEKSFLDALDYYYAAMHKADSAVLHNKAGIADLELLRQDDAQREFRRAIKMDRAYSEPYNNLGVIFYIHRKYSKAISEYKKAIKLRDSSASFHSNLGTAHFARKDYGKASAEYARALQLDPDIFERHSRGGVSLHLASAEDRAKYEYVIAKMYASAGLSDRCLLYLKKAMEDGYPEIGKVFQDREFNTIRKDPRFTALMAAKPIPISN